MGCSPGPYPEGRPRDFTQCLEFEVSGHPDAPLRVNSHPILLTTRPGAGRPAAKAVLQAPQREHPFEFPR